MQMVDHALQHGMLAPMNASEVEVIACLTQCDSIHGVERCDAARHAKSSTCAWDQGHCLPDTV